MLTRDGTTPAKLKALKEAIPPARKITKTDLAKYIHAWDKKPDFVSLGDQKNFMRFMESLSSSDEASNKLPTKEDYKLMIAKAKLFRDTHKLVRPMFRAGQVNVAIYVVSLLSSRLGDRIDLDRIWARQAVSKELMAQIETWAHEVNDNLLRTADGRLLSEWAKKPECREVMLGVKYSPVATGIPEVLYK